MYDDYRSWLKFFRRRLFDPFRRHHRIFFESSVEGPEGLVLGNQTKTVLYATTVAQLNFLFFTHTYGIFSYATQHIDVIEKDMKTCVKRHRESETSSSSSNTDSSKNRRKRLCEAPTNACFIYKIQGTIQFDEIAESKNDVGNVEIKHSESNKSDESKDTRVEKLILVEETPVAKKVEERIKIQKNIKKIKNITNNNNNNNVPARTRGKKKSALPQASNNPDDPYRHATCLFQMMTAK
jgi:hypothetical protein